MLEKPCEPACSSFTPNSPLEDLPDSEPCDPTIPIGHFLPCADVLEFSASSMACVEGAKAWKRYHPPLSKRLLDKPMGCCQYITNHALRESCLSGHSLYYVCLMHGLHHLPC